MLYNPTGLTPGGGNEGLSPAGVGNVKKLGLDIPGKMGSYGYFWGELHFVAN
jgi:hypothetical protein